MIGIIPVRGFLHKWAQWLASYTSYRDVVVVHWEPLSPPSPQLLSSLTARLSDITTLSVITSLRDFLSSIFSDISLDGLLKCNVNHPVSLLNNLQHHIWDAASSYPSLRSSFVCWITLLTELETSPVIPVDGLYLIYHRWRPFIQTQVMMLQQ